MTLFCYEISSGWQGPGYIRLSMHNPLQPGPMGKNRFHSLLVLLAIAAASVAWAQDATGGTGLYVVAGLSGLTDVDAITLSLTQFVQEGQLATDQAWRLILFANLANMVFKAGAVVVLASPALRRRVVPLFAVSVLAGTLILLFWGGGSGLVSRLVFKTSVSG